MTNWQRTGPLSRTLRAANPGPMTLDGTNSYVLSGFFNTPVATPGATPDPASCPVVVVDPGPLLEDHLAALAAAGTVELILVTHQHADHTEGSARLRELTGAPVRAAHPDFCHGGVPLRDGEVIRAAGVEIDVLATPGHTSDSVCFILREPAAQDPGPQDPAATQPARRDGGAAQVLTGDTVLGQGSTVICYPDGRLGDYLQSLEKLRALGSVAALPGHGPVLADLAAAAAGYQAHRQERLAQVSSAVDHLAAAGAEPTVEAVTDAVYGDVPANVQGAARLSVAAQLDYLDSRTT